MNGVHFKWIFNVLQTVLQLKATHSRKCYFTFSLSLKCSQHRVPFHLAHSIEIKARSTSTTRSAFLIAYLYRKTPRAYSSCQIYTTLPIISSVQTEIDTQGARDGGEGTGKQADSGRQRAATRQRIQWMGGIGSFMMFNHCWCVHFNLLLSKCAGCESVLKDASNATSV